VWPSSILAEGAAEPHGCLGADGAAAVDDVGDAAGRDAQFERQTIGAQGLGLKLVFQQPAGV